jgi:hypothetical protein
MTACVGCEIQRSGLPRRCERIIRAVVHSPAAAIAQTIDNLVGRMYERVRRFIRSKWKHDAAHQHAGKGKGQAANGQGMPAGVRAVNASAPSTPGTVDSARAQSHDDARRTKKVRTDPSSTSARCVSGLPAVARALRALAASQPFSSMRCVYAHARRTREGRPARLASLPLREHAHSRRRAHPAYWPPPPPRRARGELERWKARGAGRTSVPWEGAGGGGAPRSRMDRVLGGARTESRSIRTLCMISASTMVRNKARRTLFQLSHSRLERGVDLGKAPLRRRAQPSESAPAAIQAMTRSPEGSPMRGAQESPGRSTSTRRARSSAGGPSSASTGGCASERGGR